MSLSQPHSRISVVSATEPPYSFKNLISRMNKSDMCMLLQPLSSSPREKYHLPYW